MKKFILLMFISFNLHATCENFFQVTTEKNQEVILCEDHILQLSRACSLNLTDCQLVKDLKNISVDSKVLKHSSIGNPGSRICRALGWKVHMASLFDESQVCTCLHPSGEYITCSSLSQYYQAQSKAKK